MRRATLQSQRGKVDVSFEEVARWLAMLIGAWLIAIGLIMLLRPLAALGALGQMGSTNVIHFAELGLRLMGGIVLVVAAAGSRFPASLTLIGWFVVASSIVLMLAPRPWHAAYSTWWAKRILPIMVRLIAPFSLVAGGALICSVA